MVFVGRTFSYETWYQAVRRCWRFGQKQPVRVHLIVAEGEEQIARVIDRKAASHSEMKKSMTEAMRRAANRKIAYNPKAKARLAPWISAA